MQLRNSYSLLAVLAVIASPAFAQDAPAPEAEAPADGAAQLPQSAADLAEEAQNAADNAESAAQDAADAVNGDAAEEEAGADAATEGEAAATSDDGASAEGTAAGEANADEAESATEQPEAAAEEPASDEPAAAGEAAETGEAAAPGAPVEGGTPSEQAAEGADDEPKVGSYYAKSTHSDWTIRCVTTESGNDPCELYQLLKDSDGNSVAEMTLIPLSNGEVAAGATMVVPLETDLTKGLSFGIDGNKASGYPFSFCAPVGCVSRMGFTADELGALKGGSKANVELLPFGSDPKNPVELELSLAGFTAAYSELEQLAKEAQATAEQQGGNTEEQPAEEEAQPAE
ncbi:invasion associated locus B family protein [Paracoccus onubensis]|uniref:Invasion associated locus B family protein n=1 Tax=Paracoccus onubensis TaxID=1675788 RepID=A0A418SS16_9RHOB|nr:invasion associated locus B family protein [Paracoccus onubensis]RJE83692.1 invasion associated locus B family protein [Paracoccus onubensis]